MRTTRTLLAAAMAFAAAAPAMAASITLAPIGLYVADPLIYDAGTAEIPAYDPIGQRLFVVNATYGVEIVDISDPTNPTRVGGIEAPGTNSVAVKNGTVALAVQNANKTAPGTVQFYDASGVFKGAVGVGSLPDMLTFSPNGNYVVVANEGEPDDDYTVDPDGSVSVVDVSGGVLSASVQQAVFTAFNGDASALKDVGVRIYGPGASVAQDLEPEYIAVSPDSTKAYVTLQENNAIAVVDLATATVEKVLPLGYKDFSLPGNAIDPSDRDAGIDIRNVPVLGMYQPDGMSVYEIDGETYLVTANEGDARDYDGFSEEVRVKDLLLDPTAFPNAAELQADENIGRLRVTDQLGDTDGDGDFDELYAYGGRSVTIWKVDGDNLVPVFDSGDAFEQITAAQLPDHFNSDNAENDSFDSRSDDKGPEPEGITLGVIDGKAYAFVGLERTGGVMVYDVTDPNSPAFVEYVNTRNFDPAFTEDLLEGNPALAGDLGPEGLVFIDAALSPNGKALLVVGNEVSGTTRIYEVNPSVVIPTPAAPALFAASATLAALRRRR